MRVHRIRHVPVVEGERLVGIVSDRDARHALPMHGGTGEHDCYGKALFDTAVERVMSKRPITIDPEASVREAAEIICREKIGALPVIEDGRLVGIVSAEDLLWAFIEIAPEP
jgi:acetoin utilization protein AcuB